MRSLALITSLCALTAALAVGSAPAPAAVPGKPRVSVPVCHSDVAPLDRRITWVGQMDSIRPGNRMEMRFDVYVKTPTEPAWKLVTAPDLGIWNRAKAGTTQYKFRQKAVNLSAPASYKARVTFRWLGPGKGDKTVKVKTSKVCQQTDPRPNLRVVRLDATPLKGSMANYQVVIRNTGGSAATGPSGFDVAVAVDRVAQPSKNVLGLRPGELVQVNIRAPRCVQGGTVRAQVDPDHRIDQSDRADDVLELPCPASLAPAGS
jgi:CARDB